MILHKKAGSIPVTMDTATEGRKIMFDFSSIVSQSSINFELIFCAMHVLVVGLNTYLNSIYLPKS